MSTLRAGVIGLGVGAQHVEGYNSSEGSRTIAVCDSDPKALAAITQRHSRLKQYDNAEDLLGDPEIDIVSIASYDDVHADQAIRAIEAGKHVFVEKPLCLRKEDAVAIRAALNSNPEVQLSSNLILRMSPRFCDLRQRVSAGELGTLFHVEADYLYGRKHKLTDGWRGQVDDYSVLLGGAVHMVDLLRWVMNDEVVAVAACSNGIATRETQFRYDDMALGLLRFSSGAVGKVSANFACIHPHYHQLAIYGDQGSFINGPEQATLIRSTPKGPQTESINTPYRTLPKGLLIESFVASIRGSVAPLVTADDVFKTLSVCFALQEATQSDHWVPVHYL